LQKIPSCEKIDRSKLGHANLGSRLKDLSKEGYKCK
jgi:hypothetical protein